MALIKCPACGQTVLSVASACPKCSAPISDSRTPITSAGSLTECRRCGRPVASEARACPHCGVRGPVHGPAVRVLLVTMAFALVGTLAAGEIVPEHWARRAKSEPIAMARDSAPATPAAMPAPPAPDSAAPAHPAAADSVATDSTATPAPAVSAPAAAPADTLAAGPVPPHIPGSRPVWTTVWTNVRAGRGDSTPVVAVLRPRRLVDALNARDGWSMVYVDGIAVGYVARSLLTSARPAP